MEIKEFLKTLTTDPRARELLKGLKEPKDIKEAAGKYLEIAKELGLSIPEKGLEAFLKVREKLQKEKTEQASESVKEAVTETSLDAVAGGAEACSSSYESGEWCWFSDSCSAIINGYSDKPYNDEWEVIDHIDDDDDGVKILEPEEEEMCIGVPSRGESNYACLGSPEGVEDM